MKRTEQPTTEFIPFLPGPRQKLNGMNSVLHCRPLLACAAAVALLVVVAGCGHPDAAGKSAAAAASTGGSQQQRNLLLQTALQMLGKMEQFDQQPALEQIVDRLNESQRDRKSNIEWKADPLIDTLPKPLAEHSGPWLERLGDELFDRELDANFLKEAAWLRDISNYNRGDKADDLSIAEHLFDWTVRNIQLMVDLQPKPGEQAPLSLVARRLPWEVVLLGRGTVQQRAWVFMLLARQQGLDVVMLAVADPAHPKVKLAWVPALLHKGELYLFDPALGLPIPGPGGKGIATLRQAAEDPAVLDQLDLDESHHYPVKAAEVKKVWAIVEASPGYLSRRMKALESQLAGTDRIVLTAAPEQIAARLQGLAHVDHQIDLWTFPFQTLATREAQDRAIENPPAQNAQARQYIKQFATAKAAEMYPYFVPNFRENDVPTSRGPQQHALEELMAQGENPDEAGRQIVELQKEAGELAGDNSEKAAKRRAEIEQEIAGLRQIQAGSKKLNLPRPVKMVFPLWAGRLLHFRGHYGGEYGAKHFYILSRPGEDQIPAYVGQLADDWSRDNNARCPPVIVAEYLSAVRARKQDATFWLGLISFDEHEYSTAEDYFKLLPQGAGQRNLWADGARYNLARSYEAEGRTAEAIKLYEEDDSPQRHGNRLRARSLKAAADKRG